MLLSCPVLSSVPWFLGAAAGSTTSHQRQQASREPHASVYLGGSLLTLEGPVHAVDWVTRTTVDGYSDHSTWSWFLPNIDEQTASAFAAL